MPEESATEPHGEDHGSRSQWAVALMTQPRDVVVSLAEKLAERYSARHLSLPKAGLAMLPLTESVLGETFNLGEFTLSTSHVELVNADQQTVQGAAAVMADDAQLATAIAVCDGVLFAQWDGWQEIAALVQAGRTGLAETARTRRAMLASSRVDFSLLNEDG